MRCATPSTSIAIALLAILASTVAAAPASNPPPAGGGTALVRAVDAPTSGTLASGPLVFVPPLSLADCQGLVGLVQRSLPPAGAPPLAPPELDSVLRAIAATYNYLNFRDDLHTSLSEYTWVLLESKTVDDKKGRPDTEQIVFRPPVELISALSIESSFGDTLVHAISIYDEKGELRDEHDYRKEPRLIRHGLPRREVFHLWRRTTVGRIDITYSRPAAAKRTEPRPRVAIYGGITQRQEHIKAALYYLRNTRESVETGRWEDAHRNLRRAQERLAATIAQQGTAE